MSESGESDVLDGRRRSTGLITVGFSLLTIALGALGGSIPLPAGIGAVGGSPGC